jgi:hypothetical protein
MYPTRSNAQSCEVRAGAKICLGARMRSVVKSSIGAGKTSRAKNETTHSHRYCCSSHTHDSPAQPHQHQHQPAPRCAVCLCPRRTANSPVACCVRPLPGVCQPTADSPLRASVLRAELCPALPCTLRTPRRIAHRRHRPAYSFECRHTTMSSFLALSTATFLEHPIS